LEKAWWWFSVAFVVSVVNPEPLLFPLLQGARSCFPSAKRGRALPQPFDKLRGACSTAYP